MLTLDMVKPRLWDGYYALRWMSHAPHGSQESWLTAETLPRCADGRPFPHRQEKAASIHWRLLLHTGDSRARVAGAQRHSHAALLIDLRGRGPVDFIGGDHAIASAGQFVADASVLVGVIAYRQNCSGFQHEHRNSRSCAGEA